MGQPPFEGAQLERVNNEKSYSKSNCRWATRSENARNKRNNVWLEYGGKQCSLYDLEKVAGVSAKNIYQRVFTYGWSVERAVTEPT